MRIDAMFPSYYFPAPQVTASPKQTEQPEINGPVPRQNNLYNQPDVVEISPEARQTYGKVKAAEDVFKTTECQTCKNRKYQDSSSDPSVSFQAPTHINPNQAGAAVASHEAEHVAHEQVKAEKEDRKIVSQTVSLSSSICPECGRLYISGGVTRTITASKPDTPEAQEENTD